MKRLSLLIKSASGNCNMQCVYCFYTDVSQARSIENYGFMKEATLEIIVKKALEETTETCAFAFQGGEPSLIGLDFYKKLVALQEKYNVNFVNIQNSIQTNGILITNEWAEFFAAHGFLVGISIDGYASLHDSFRLTLGAKATHSKCMQAVKLFKKYGVGFNILSVVTKQLAAHPEKLYKFYKNNNFRYVQFIPCIDDFETEGDSLFSLTPKVYGDFLCRIFDLWYKDFVSGNYYSIRIFDNYIHILMGTPPESCAMRGACTAYPTIEADGSVFPCDFYVVDKYYLGNIKESSFKDILAGDSAKDFMKQSLMVDSLCKICDYLPLCRGGCRRDRQKDTGEYLIINRYCSSYKSFFNHALPRMVDIAKRLST